jgi:hypothetical protein
VEKGGRRHRRLPHTTSTALNWLRHSLRNPARRERHPVPMAERTAAQVAARTLPILDRNRFR